MQKTALLLLLFTLFSCTKETKKEIVDIPKHGLLIIDAQKWFIPGHPESLYETWGIKGHDRSSDEIINSMDSVLVWANTNNLPVFVTYEGLDTGAYDLPKKIKNHIDSNTTQHFVKLFYGALKHKKFEQMLLKSNIKDWIVIGAETDVCVYQTVRELLRRNMNVTLVKEAVYSGKNDTRTSYQNLVKFGADTVSLANLHKSLVNKNQKTKLDPDIKYKDVIVTIVKNEIQDTTTGNYIRLKYLKQYAQIINLEVEETKSISSIKKTNKTRVFAGFLPKTIEQNENIIVLEDCITSGAEINNDTIHIKTLKIFFYELMETADFYAKSPSELSGWLQRLKKAMESGELGYVESTQNIN